MANQENINPIVDAELPPEDPQLSVMQDFMLFLKENKKWWLLPMILIVFGLGALLMLGSGPMAPFIYSLF